MSNIQQRITEYNRGKIDPEKCFVKGSHEQQALLDGKIKFPLKWVKEAQYHKGHLNMEGMPSYKFFRQSLKQDPELSHELYTRKIIDITMDTLYDCSDIWNETSRVILNNILDNLSEIPIGYWKHTYSQCLHNLIFKSFDDNIKIVCIKLIQRGANFNDLYSFMNIVDYMLTYNPKALTLDKLEFMLQNGLNIQSYADNRVSKPLKFTNVLQLMTFNIDLDTYIQMLLLIKKYNPNL